MSSTMALKRLDPFGKRDLGGCAACGDWITWKDKEMVQVVVEERQPVSFHRSCFEAFRTGLNLFAELVLRGPEPHLSN